MDVAKVAKDYFLSSQSSLLIPNSDFGSRKMIHVGGSRGGSNPFGRSMSTGSIKESELPLPPPETPSSPSSSSAMSSSFSIQQRQGRIEEGDVMGDSGYSHSGGDTPDGFTTTNSSKPTGLKGLLVSGGKNLSNLSMGNLRRRHSGSLRLGAGTKQWLHPPEALQKGQILYTVKFLGECTVEQPKGTEVVKDAIRKMKFNKHIRRSEGLKPPKVELTVSADAVKVLDPKTKTIMHQYPLHRISYCADDKSDKRMFTFIAKAATNDDHFCYVFDSEKCAEEITLTIGQAFDLAYKQFLEASNSDSDLRRQCVILQKRVQTLQFENEELKKRLVQMEKLKNRSDVEEYMKNNQIHDLTTFATALRESSTDDDDSLYSTPTKQSQPSMVGRRLENLILSEEHPPAASNGQHTNGRHHSVDSSPSPGAMPMLTPPPASSRPAKRGNNSVNVGTPSSQGTNPFTNMPMSAPTTPANNSAVDPFGSNSVDPFGMEVFSPIGVTGVTAPNSQQDILDMQAGFSQGLSFGTDDFSLNDLDPLGQRM